MIAGETCWIMIITIEYIDYILDSVSDKQAFRVI